MKIHFIKSIHTDLTIALAEIVDLESNLWISKERKFSDLGSIHPKKKLEFLATRLLVEQTCLQSDLSYEGIIKDEYGKPHLANTSYHLSVSHSYPFVTCCIHKKKSCGIDIESSRSQLLKIKHKFLNTSELEYCGEDLNKLCLHWSAKETLYKIHGRKNLVFAQNLSISAHLESSMIGTINIDKTKEQFELKYEKFKKYFIVYNT